MEQNRYFLPEKLGYVLTHECAIGVISTSTIMEKDGFKIPGYLITGSPEDLAVFLEKAPAWGMFDRILSNLTATEEKSGLAVYGDARVDGKECSILSLKPLVAEDLMDCGSKLTYMRDLHADIKKTLENLSVWIGHGVLLATPETKQMRPKVDQQMYSISIVVDASPPGDAPVVKHKELCKIELTDDDRVITHAGPARGYGTMVKDDAGEIVAQIIDDTIYVFVPLISACRNALMDEKGPGLFKRVLRLAWNARFEAPTTHEEASIGSVEEYGAILQGGLECLSATQRRQVVEISTQIARLEERQRRLLAEKRMALMLLRQCETLCQEVNREQWEKDWIHLSSLPSVKRLSVVDGGIHIETDSLVTTYEGIRYQLGSFIIRYCDGEISVWSQTPAHARGRAHPHISEVGSICFGNVGIAIRTAAMEMRVADAVELVLRWLTQGYDPELADIRIEEWPHMEEQS